jgi:hypothetical protein
MSYDSMKYEPFHYNDQVQPRDKKTKHYKKCGQLPGFFDRGLWPLGMERYMPRVCPWERGNQGFCYFDNLPGVLPLGNV